MSYPLDTDYFSIFNANTSKIGKISDCFERELVVQTYMLAKYFIDCLKTNNECLSYFEKIEEKYKNNRNCNEYKEDIKFANDNLKHSKINNILPTYKKLKVLLETYLTMQNNKRWWQI